MAMLRKTAVLLVGILGVACGGGSEGADTECEPGRAEACTCEDGSPGARICRSDGSGWSDCQCDQGTDADADADGDTDADGDADADSDADADADTDADADSDADADADGDSDADSDADADGDTDADADADADSDSDSDTDTGPEPDPCAAALGTDGLGYDFESGAQGFTHFPTSGYSGDDPWDLGDPVNTSCHSGTHCWATNLDGNYPNCQTAYLVSPIIDLSACTGSMTAVELSFWHHYLFENQSSGTWWDGGLVQLSADGGVSWSDAAPSPGYTGAIDMGSGCSPNPEIDGHFAWSGDIPGGVWERVAVAVDDGFRTAQFRVRFLFGSDSSSTDHGWAVDDVLIDPVCTPQAALQCVGGDVHWFDSCGFDGGVALDCPVNSVCVEHDATDAVCECTGHWTGPTCDSCEPGWDPETDCTECMGALEGPDCDICPPGWDVNAGCAACLPHFDPATDCATCLAPWQGTACDECPENWNELDGCATCEGGWNGPDCDVPCVIRVDLSSAPGGDGLSWVGALDTVQQGIDAAAAAIQEDEEIDQCEVWLAEGAYYVFDSEYIDTVSLRPGVWLYGGFSGTETSREERDPTAHQTTIDGHAWAGSFEQVYHVLTGADDAVLDGLTITGGKADGEDLPYASGGGLYLDGTSPIVRGCRFVGNIAIEANQGGGMYSGGAAIWGSDASPFIEDCVFQDNVGRAVVLHGGEASIVRCTFDSNAGGALRFLLEASSTIGECAFLGNSAGSEDGGAIRSDSSDVAITDTVFTGNLADNGGAVQMVAGYVAVENCRFEDNDATGSGGAVYGSSSKVLFSNSIFLDNAANSNGGGMYCSGCHWESRIWDCRFLDNSSTTGSGGAMALVGSMSSSSSPRVIGCVLDGNDAADDGGGLYGGRDVRDCRFTNNTADRGGGLYGSSGELENLVFAGNSADIFGGGLMIHASSYQKYQNVVVYGNTASSGGGVYVYSTGGLFTNFTVTGNAIDADGVGGAMFHRDSTSRIVNGIFWGNDGSTIHVEDSSAYYDYSPEFEFSDVEGGGFTGVGNIDADPLFTGPPWPNGHWAAVEFDEETFRTALSVFWETWEPHSLKGMILRPNTADPRFAIVDDNDATTIFVDGNLAAFVAEPDGFEIIDLTPGAGSPCIDAAKGSVAADGYDLPPFDILGNGRIDDAASPNSNTGSPPYADLGALEAQDVEPSTDTDNGTPVRLFFYEASEDYNTYEDVHEIWVGPASSTNPQDGDWDLLADAWEMGQQGDHYWWDRGLVLDLSYWRGQSIRIAFYFHARSADWNLDDICVSETESTTDPPDCAVFGQSFDTVTVPALPSGWIGSGWTTSAATHHSAPNSLGFSTYQWDDGYAISPSFAIPD